MGKIARYTLIATLIGVTAYALSTPAKADSGFVVRGTVEKNLDSASDYWQDGKKMQGSALVQVGYKLQGENGALESGIFHLSNPFSSTDYGMNGVYISGCFGKGC
jgi:hypothetical protein